MADNVVFYFCRLIFLFFLVCLISHASAGNKTTATPTTSAKVTNVTTTKTTQNSTTTQPTKPTTVQPTTVPPTNHSTIPPGNHSTIPPGNHSTRYPRNYTTPHPENSTTAQPGNYSTVPPTVSPTAHSKDCHTCEDELTSEKHYKWVAIAFDIIFAIALVIMTILYLRQRKMYREMEGDSSLSRLI